jgi:cytochrome b561/polyisoprenoid-binding protein YceI
VQPRYSLGAIILHWLLALALAFQLSLGLGLDDLGPRGFALYQFHKSIGIAVLILSLLRLLWRLTHKPLPAKESGWQGAVAKTVHAALYLFMIGAPVTGWLMVSTDRVKVPTLLFGTVPWPHLPLPRSLNGFAHESHELLGWLGIALILLHVAGAVRHQWLLKDNIMGRMAPGRGTWLVLALLVPAGWAFGLVMLGNTGPAPVAKEAPAPAPLATSATPAPANEIAAVTTPTEAPTTPPIWTVQPGGTLAFSVSNGADTVSGRFGKWRGDIAFDPEHPESAAITITVDLASASVGDATQDAMLAGTDFFDAAAHPRATYRVTSVRVTTPGHYAARGTLSLKDKVRPQTLAFRLTGRGLSRHVEGSATIDRNAFRIGAGDAAQNLAPEVTLSFSFDAKGASKR